MDNPSYVQSCYSVCAGSLKTQYGEMSTYVYTYTPRNMESNQTTRIHSSFLRVESRADSCISLVHIVIFLREEK